ncbi:MAG TPA: hypothetical protein VMT18_08170 [Planctomycetota bacterium]|nr:hypothetical protein [Planctomycetota bacterium]
MQRTSLGLAFLCSLLACRSSKPAAPPPGISGQLQVVEFRVPAGETLWVDGDLVVSSTGPIAIDGRLVARDAAELGLQDAPRIELISALAIDVPGEVLGGRGTDVQRTRGGHGSSVVLRAPWVRVQGRVVAGAGGAGGLSLPGGKGGDALVRGMLEGSGEAGHVALRSGAGGRGGANGGVGGANGDAGVHEPQDRHADTYALREQALAALARMRR